MALRIPQFGLRLHLSMSQLWTSLICPCRPSSTCRHGSCWISRTRSHHQHPSVSPALHLLSVEPICRPSESTPGDPWVIEGSRCGCREVDRRACLFPAGLGWREVPGCCIERRFPEGYFTAQSGTSLSYETLLLETMALAGGGAVGPLVGTSFLARGTSSMGASTKGAQGDHLCPTVRLSGSPSNRRSLGFVLQSRGRLQKTSAEPYAGIRSLVVAYDML